MVLNNIEQLLEKYENGETSLQEEQQLKHYFTSDAVAPHLEHYKAMFQYFIVTHEEQFTGDVPLKSNKPYYKWISVAAVVAIMFTVYMQYDKSVDYEDLTKDQQLAINQTVEGLQMLGLTLNKSSEGMKSFNLMSQALNKGTEKVSHIGEFSKATNRILKQN